MMDNLAVLTYGLMAVQQCTVYSKVDYLPGYPYNCNMNGIEFTVIRVGMLPDVTIVGVYRSPQISVQQMYIALRNLLCSLPITSYQLFLGDFNMNWFEISNQNPLYRLLVKEYYRQLISEFTTDNRTCIDHVYTNLNDKDIKTRVYESYFSDHKPIYVILHT